MMRQVWNRLRLIYAQGVGVLIGANKVQTQVLDEETLENIDRVEPYGFSYRPKPGCETYLLFPAGDRSYGVAIIIGDKRYQMSLAEGEVAMHDDEGNHVHLKRGGIIEAKASTKVIADTPLFETTKDCKIGGNLEVLGTTHLAKDVTCDTNVTATANVTAAMVFAGGFSAAGGGAAVMPGGLNVTGAVLANGKNINDAHTHTTNALGAATSGVN